MSRISVLLSQILSAVYGRDVRQSIHDSIAQCYSDVTAAKTLADDSTAAANAAIQNANSTASNANDKASLANTAASSANTAASNANTAATNCNAATEALPTTITTMFGNLGLVEVDGKLCVEVERE